MMEFFIEDDPKAFTGLDRPRDLRSGIIKARDLLEGLKVDFDQSKLM